MRPRKKLTPTQIIERSPADLERGWNKKPCRQPVRASYKEKKSSAYIRIPKKGETMQIHQHIHEAEERQFVLPSPVDIRRRRTRPKVTEVIAIREAGQVAGYTFAKIRNPKKTRKLKKFTKVRKMPRSFLKYLSSHEEPLVGQAQKEQFAENIRKAAKKIDKAGLKLRFVANKNAGFFFDPRRMQFVRRRK